MNTVTITIKDNDQGAIEMEGKVEDEQAFDKPPTGALIIGSYLAAHAEKVSKDAMAWFSREIVAAPKAAAEEKQIDLFVPNKDIKRVN